MKKTESNWGLYWFRLRKRFWDTSDNSGITFLYSVVFGIILLFLAIGSIAAIIALIANLGDYAWIFWTGLAALALVFLLYKAATTPYKKDHEYKGAH